MKIKVFSVVLLALVCSMSLMAGVYAHDINGDGYANWYDFKRVVLHFGDSGPPGWIPEDVIVDGVINMKDVAAVARQMQLTPTNVDILPATIIVPPEGQGLKYVTALIELPEADVHDIDPDSIDLVVAICCHKFPAQRLIEYLRTAFPDPGSYSLEMIVAGVVLPGTLTLWGTDVVNIRIM